MEIINSLLSNFMLIVITLVGFSFIFSGKPKKQVSKIKLNNNKYYYQKEYNSTGKLIRLLVIILFLYFLGSSV